MNNLFRHLALVFKSAFEKRTKKESVNESSSFGTEGKFFRLWSWALPLLLGLTAGWFGMVCLEVWLEGRNARNRPSAVAPGLMASVQDVGADKMAVFLRVNPFGITPMPTPDLIEPDYYEPPTQIVGSLAGAILKGTSPGFMAWMEVQGALRLVLVGDKFDAYTLVEVTHMDATFAYGDERVVKEIIFGNRPVAQPAPSTQRLRGGRTPNTGQVVPSDAALGTTGAINREMVNHLLENPFDELRKIRIRPADAEQGLQVEWITNDSILAQLGVQQNDIVRAVNGIVFRNAMDITNSLNSLMDSDQFVVEVVRNGAPTLLQYVVR